MLTFATQFSKADVDIRIIIFWSGCRHPQR